LGEVAIDGQRVAPFDADAVTLNPYLGTDSVEPFVAACRQYGKGAFVLVRTSNPSGAELQNLDAGGQPLYARVARLVAQWGSALVGQCGYSSVGAVVGATCREEAGRIRELLPSAYFLVPGYGAQGGAAQDVAACFRPDGLGAIVNSSRAIIHAYAGHGRAPHGGTGPWRDAIEAAVKAMNRDLRSAIPTLAS